MPYPFFHASSHKLPLSLSLYLSLSLSVCLFARDLCATHSSDTWCWCFMCVWLQVYGVMFDCFSVVYRVISLSKSDLAHLSCSSSLPSLEFLTAPCKCGNVHTPSMSLREVVSSVLPLSVKTQPRSDSHPTPLSLSDSTHLPSPLSSEQPASMESESLPDSNQESESIEIAVVIKISCNGNKRPHTVSSSHSQPQSSSSLLSPSCLCQYACTHSEDLETDSESGNVRMRTEKWLKQMEKELGL